MSISAFASLNSVKYTGDLQISGGQLGFTVFASAANFDQTADFITLNNLYYLDPTANGNFDLVKIENSFGQDTCVPGYSFWLSNESPDFSLTIQERSTSTVQITLAPFSSCYLIAKEVGVSGTSPDQWTILNNFPIAQGSSGLTYLLIYVDAQFGDDSTGELDNPARPYQTITAASAAALAFVSPFPGRDYILRIRPGLYVEPTITDTVNWYMEDGAILESDSTAAAVDTNVGIYGYGIVRSQGGLLGNTVLGSGASGYMELNSMSGTILSNSGVLIIRDPTSNLTMNNNRTSDSFSCPFGRFDGGTIRAHRIYVPVLGSATVERFNTVYNLLSDSSDLIGTPFDSPVTTIDTRGEIFSSIIINPISTLDSTINTSYISDTLAATNTLSQYIDNITAGTGEFLANRVEILDGNNLTFPSRARRLLSIGIINIGSILGTLSAEKISSDFALTNNSSFSGRSIIGEVTGTVEDNPTYSLLNGIFGRINTNGNPGGLSLVNGSLTFSKINVYVMDVENVEILRPTNTVVIQTCRGTVDLTGSDNSVQIGLFEQGSIFNNGNDLSVEVFRSDGTITNELEINGTSNTQIGRYELGGSAVTTEMTLNSTPGLINLMLNEVVQISASHNLQINLEGSLPIRFSAQQLTETSFLLPGVFNCTLDIQEVQTLNNNFLTANDQTNDVANTLNLNLGYLRTNGFDLNLDGTGSLICRLEADLIEFPDANVFRLEANGLSALIYLNCQRCSMMSTTLTQLLTINSSSLELLIQGRYQLENTAGVATINGLVYNGGTVTTTGCKRTTLRIVAPSVGPALVNNSTGALDFYNESPLVSNSGTGGSQPINLIFASPDFRDQLNTTLNSF